MKVLILGILMMSSTVAFGVNVKPSSDTPKGLGQYDPQQCGCETCFTKYGVCTSVNQNLVREEVGRKITGGKRGRGSVVGGQ